jgi:hypothetical protein
MGIKIETGTDCTDRVGTGMEASEEVMKNQGAQTRLDRQIFAEDSRPR